MLVRHYVKYESKVRLYLLPHLGNALAASLGANVATAGLLDLDDVPAWLRILVAGWPAVAFLGGTLLAHTRSR